MDWNNVAAKLDGEAEQIRMTATNAFAVDPEVQKEMRTRACLMESFARAIRAGLPE